MFIERGIHQISQSPRGAAMWYCRTRSVGVEAIGQRRPLPMFIARGMHQTP